MYLCVGLQRCSTHTHSSPPPPPPPPNSSRQNVHFSPLARNYSQPSKVYNPFVTIPGPPLHCRPARLKDWKTKNGKLKKGEVCKEQYQVCNYVTIRGFLEQVSLHSCVKPLSPIGPATAYWLFVSFNANVFVCGLT